LESTGAADSSKLPVAVGSGELVQIELNGELRRLFFFWFSYFNYGCSFRTFGLHFFFHSEVLLNRFVLEIFFIFSSKTLFPNFSPFPIFALNFVLEFFYFYFLLTTFFFLIFSSKLYCFQFMF